MTDHDLDQLYETIDEHLLAGEFQAVDDCLRSLVNSPDDGSTVAIGGILTITYAARSELPSRVPLLKWARSEMNWYEEEEE